MKFSTKTTYGLRALYYLRKSGKTASLSEVASAEKISLPYLERIFACLKKAGLVRSVKGAKGGYHLALPLSEITLFDVVNVLEGPLSLFYCLNENSKTKCSLSCRCQVNRHLSEAQARIAQALKQIKLNEL